MPKTTLRYTPTYAEIGDINIVGADRWTFGCTYVAKTKDSFRFRSSDVARPFDLVPNLFFCDIQQCG